MPIEVWNPLLTLLMISFVFTGFIYRFIFIVLQNDDKEEK